MEYTEEDIQELVKKAQFGETESFSKLFNIFADRLFNFFRFRVSEKETAEDLTQTVFLEIIQGLVRYQRKENTKFSTWLFQIARFRLIDHYRQYRPNLSLDELETTSSPLKVNPSSFESSEIDKALSLLPEKYQTVLHLRFREELDPLEVAKILKITVINVRVIQHRALKALKKILEEK